MYFLVTGTWLFHEQLPAGPARLGLRLAAIAVAGIVLVILSRPREDQAEQAVAAAYAADPGRR